MTTKTYNDLLTLFTPTTMPTTKEAAATGWESVLQDKGIPTLNPKDYGAVGDGITDDYAALQATLDAVPSGGALVYVPEGTFVLNAGWLQIKKSGTRLRGAGRDRTVLKSTRAVPSNPPPDGLFGLVNSFALSSIVVEDLAFLGTATLPVGTWVGDTQIGVVEKACYFTSILAPGGVTHGAYNDIIMRRCRATGMHAECFYTEHNFPGGATDYVEISACQCFNSASNTFNVNAGPWPNPALARIVDNYQENCNGGIQSGGTVNVIQGNHRKDTVTSTATWILCGALFSDVSENVAYNADTSATGVALIDIHSFSNTWKLAANIHDNVLVNNLVYGGGGAAGTINVSCAGGPVRVANNTIWNCGASGVGIAIAVQKAVAGVGGVDATTDVAIEHNSVYGGTNGSIGISLASGIGSNLIRIVGNQLMIATDKSYNAVTPKLDIYNTNTTT